MQCGLRQALGRSAGLDRELGFRHVVATRNDVGMLWRYGRFALTHTPVTGEWNAVRSWILRRLPGRSHAPVPATLGDLAA